MLKKSKSLLLIMTSIALVCMVACNGREKAVDTADADTIVDTAMVAQDVYEELTEGNIYYEEAFETPAEKPQPKPSAKKETIYISGFGANGEVWGSVVMNGNKGKGTIHDAQENTLAITCTRQGNELIAIDQNSRQYIFKVK